VFESLTEAQWVGFSFVLLGMALIGGMLVRKAVPWLAAVYIPTSVLAGLLILLAGPQVLGEVTSGWSLIPAQTVAVLSALPGLLINVVFGGILTALSVPLILSIGSLSFGIASTAATAGLITWGLVRNRRP
jgi:ESS family glutamate:Na+ symporter